MNIVAVVVKNQADCQTGLENTFRRVGLEKRTCPQISEMGITVFQIFQHICLRIETGHIPDEITVKLRILLHYVDNIQMSTKLDSDREIDRKKHNISSDN